MLERLRQEIIGAKAQPLDLVVELAEPGQDQDRGIDLRLAQLLQNVIPVHVRQHQIEQDDIVGMQFAVLDPGFAAMGEIADKILRLQHDLDSCRCHQIIFNHEDAHRVTFESAGRTPFNYHRENSTIGRIPQKTRFRLVSSLGYRV